jgi:hypothetical protein
VLHDGELIDDSPSADALEDLKRKVVHVRALALVAECSVRVYTVSIRTGVKEIERESKRDICRKRCHTMRQ